MLCMKIPYFLRKAIFFVDINALILRKYATHLFTTPLSNVIFDNMMSRLILTLTKQFFDNQFTHFKINT